MTCAAEAIAPVKSHNMWLVERMSFTWEMHNSRLSNNDRYNKLQYVASVGSG
jgi:hypothetical protein